MKPKTIIASAAVATLCTVYLVRLSNQVTKQASALPAISTANTYNQPVQASAPVSEVNALQLDDALKSLKTKKSIVNIDNSQPCQVYGEEGTVLYLPPQIFCTADGQPYTGTVRIELDECYEVGDMLAANLSTTSDGRLLETAGMVNIKATGNGERLQLRDGAQYNIYFPKNEEQQNDFQLFYGEWLAGDVINWKLDTETQPLPETEISTYDVKEKSIVRNLRYDGNEQAQTSMAKLNFDPYTDGDYLGEEWWSEGEMWEEETVEFEPEQGQRKLKEDDNCYLHIAKSYLRRGTKVSEMDFFNWQLTNGQTLNQWFVSNFNPDIGMLEDYCLNKLRTQITFQVDSSGAFKSYYIGHTSNTVEYDRVLADFLSTMPPLDLDQLMPTYTFDHACMLTFGTAAGSSQDGFVQQFKAKHPGKPDEQLSNVETATLDYFVYSSSELGWINCDRFYEDGPRVDYTVNTNSEDCIMSMVFTDINSVLKGAPEGGHVVFTDIPANRPVKLVAIRTDGKKAEMSVVASNTSKRTADMKEYKPASINAIQKEFSK
ncbi:MAG: hypothetical protein ACKVOR_02135 [Flavobacteriales bacterium]